MYIIVYMLKNVIFYNIIHNSSMYYYNYKCTTHYMIRIIIFNEVIFYVYFLNIIELKIDVLYSAWKVDVVIRRFMKTVVLICVGMICR